MSADTPLASLIDQIYGPILELLRHWGTPGWLEFLAGIGSLLLAFNVLDRALPEISAERSSFQRIGQLVYRPAAMFLLGAAVTSVTLSVSVSLSILVPLSAKGLVRRENTLPYIMGANITTFIDTLVAALIQGGPRAFTIVLVEMVSVTILSLLVLLLFYRPFERAILRLQELIIRNNRTLGVFLCTMLIVPVGLLLVKLMKVLIYAGPAPSRDLVLQFSTQIVQRVATAVTLVTGGGAARRPLLEQADRAAAAAAEPDDRAARAVWRRAGGHPGGRARAELRSGDPGAAA